MYVIFKCMTESVERLDAHARSVFRDLCFCLNYFFMNKINDIFTFCCALYCWIRQNTSSCWSLSHACPKNYTQEYCFLCSCFLWEAQLALNRARIKNSINIFWHPGGDLWRWWLHRMLSKSLGLVHLLPSEILYRVCGWSSSDKPMATAEQTTSLASSWHCFSQESTKHTSFCSLFCLASSCKPEIQYIYSFSIVHPKIKIHSFTYMTFCIVTPNKKCW